MPIKEQTNEIQLGYLTDVLVIDIYDRWHCCYGW